MTGVDLRSYVPRLALDWPAGVVHRQVEGTLLFVDLSGFTRLSERLARRGHVGAEELTGVLDLVFGDLITVASSFGGSMLKYGGDALLLFFWEEGHAGRGAAAALALQDALGRVGRVDTEAGPVRLRMSAGAHTGAFDFYLVGQQHRELVATGPAVSQAVAMEAAAEAGQVLVSPALREALPGATFAPGQAGGSRLRRWRIEPEAFVSAPGTEAAPFIPAALLRHLGAGGHEPEHRQVAVAFVGFSGADRMRPDRLARDLDLLVTAAQDACEDNGVSFLSSDVSGDGGKLILVAGAPTAVEDAEERVIRCARAVVAAGGTLATRAGVHRGPVFAGDVGPPFRRTYTIIGDTVNTAARVMVRAGAGEVLATPDVLERTVTVFTAVAVAPFAAKGKAKPLEAAAVGAPTPLRRTRRTEHVGLVGRDAELRQLVDAVAAAERGAGAAFDIAGEPGVGKSRLLYELRRRTAGVEWIGVDAEPYDAMVPWLQARRLIAPRLGLRADGTAASRARDLRIRVALVAPHLEPLIPLIGLAFGLDLQPTDETRAITASGPGAGTDADRAAARLAGALAELFVATIAGPAIIVVDDAHWADPASRRVEAAIAALVPHHPWVFISARRPEAEPLPDGAPIHLHPLTAGDTEELVQAAVQGHLLPQVTADLAQRSGGVPLYALELAAAAGAAPAEIPDKLESLIAARIDRLLPADRATLRALAVVGTTFTVPFVEQAVGADRSVWSRLDPFIELDGNRGRFRQPLFREVAYAGLPFRRRRQLHGTVADLLLESSKPEQEPVEALALHYGRAGDAERAYTYACAAGQQAEERFAFLSAARFYAEAADHAVRAGQTEETVGLRRKDQGNSLLQAGDLSGADAALAAAARRLRDPAVRARLCLLRGEVNNRTGRFERALRWYRRGLEECRDDSRAEADLERFRLQLGAAVICVEQGRWARAIALAERTVPIAPDDDESGLAYAYLILHQAYIGAGRTPPVDYAERALEIYERLKKHRLVARVLNSLGVEAHRRGDFNRAVELYSRSRTALIEAGEVLPAAAVANNLAEMLVDEGRYAEAKPAFEDALAVSRAAGQKAYVGVISGNLAHVAAMEGRFADADALTGEALEILDGLGAVGPANEVRARHAARLLLEGRYGEAHGAAHELEGKVDDTLRPMLLRVRGECEAALGDREGALTTLRRAFEQARSVTARREEEAILTAMQRLQDTPG